MPSRSWCPGYCLLASTGYLSWIAWAIYFLKIVKSVAHWKQLVYTFYLLMELLRYKLSPSQSHKDYLKWIFHVQMLGEFSKSDWKTSHKTIVFPGISSSVISCTDIHSKIRIEIWIVHTYHVKPWIQYCTQRLMVYNTILLLTTSKPKSLSGYGFILLEKYLKQEILLFCWICSVNIPKEYL